MQSISCFGAAGIVTGSNFLLTGNKGDKILIDFGMFQGDAATTAHNFEKLPFKPSDISAVLLTHAHLDHCGRLPLLVYAGFKNKIYMTSPTRALSDLVLLDSARIAKENIHKPALYTEEEVYKVLEMVEIIDYEQEFHVGDFKISFFDAGHILGAASILLVEKSTGKKIVFSGDIGNFPQDLVRPTKFIKQADYVVMETTYGDRVHSQEDASEIIAEEIRAVEKNGGTLLIPAFSLERTQELLHRIHHLKKEAKVLEETPVFFDSPMGITATEIFKDFKEYYNDELKKHTDNPFAFGGLVITSDTRDSKDIKKAWGAKVIIAGSGMMTGGRILGHARLYLPELTTRLLFVGYQAEQTLGRKILEKPKRVTIGDESITLRAKVRDTQALSSHADQPKLLEWLGNVQGVQKVILVHGEEDQRRQFVRKVKDELKIKDIVLPQMREKIQLS